MAADSLRAVQGARTAGSQAKRHARKVGLRYTTDAEPGLRRVRAGKGFRYLHADGRPIRDHRTLERIKALVIPPAYENVWICRHANGHLQATGLDARRRKQYRYHPDWRRVRDQDKFRRMIDFGRALPAIRRRVAGDLKAAGLVRDKVLALIVSLLDRTYARVGNGTYADRNGTYGLSTLQDRHASFAGDNALRLRFPGKRGARHDIAVTDERLVRLVRRCQQLPGQSLFQFVEGGVRHTVDSGQVNRYLCGITDDTFTAKDFRTWHATVRTVVHLSQLEFSASASERSQASAIAGVVAQVAGELNNTPAVCRKSYINPAVFDAWRAGLMRPLKDKNLQRAPRRAEQATLRLLHRLERGIGRARAKRST